MEQKQVKKIAVGAGVVATVAAVAAGAYWLYGAEDAAKHRKQVKGWMLRARAEVMEALEKMEDIDKKKYLALVQEVVGRYTKHAGVTAEQITQVTRELKNAWEHIEGTKNSSGKSGVAKKSTAKRKAKTPARS